MAPLAVCNVSGLVSRSASTRHKNVRALLRSGQEASGLFLYLPEICVGLGWAIVLVGSVSGASPHVKEACCSWTPQLQGHTSKSLHPDQDVHAPLCAAKTIKQGQAQVHLSASQCPLLVFSIDVMHVLLVVNSFISDI